MKLALTVWDGRISPVFDVCRQALVLDVASGQVSARSMELLESASPSGKVDRLAALGVDTVVCGAISAPVRQALLGRGIAAYGFVAGEVDEVLRAAVTDTISDPSLRMPGYREDSPGNGGTKR